MIKFSEELLKLSLPSEIFNFFEVSDLQDSEDRIDLYLSELNITPEEYSESKLTSKGFLSPIIIQDFPIREKAFYLHLKRRRWKVESTDKIISRNWEAVAKGTRYTKGFAAFLKEILR